LELELTDAIRRMLLKERLTMKRVLVTAASLVLCVPVVYAAGAVARNPHSNDSAVVVNKATAEDAKHDAMLACGSDCEIVKSFQDSCVAYAADHKQGSTRYGIGEASTEDRAGELALDKCQEAGGSCTVMASGCDGK
jgi:Domain of unknown function (DUF4189)